MRITRFDAWIGLDAAASSVHDAPSLLGLEGMFVLRCLVAVLMLVGGLSVGCTKASWRDPTELPPDAGLEQDAGGARPVAVGSAQDGSAPAGPVRTDAARPDPGAVDNVGGSPPSGDAAAGLPACIVGVARLGECLLR